MNSAVVATVCIMGDTVQAGLTYVKVHGEVVPVLNYHLMKSPWKLKVQTHA
jgi:hypothetical protein